MMQTILGSGGAIGIPLARELKKYTNEIRLISRNPQKVNPADELYRLDLNNFAGISEAIKGSEVVYLTIGLEYRLKVWQEVWPPLMKAVIRACKEHQAKLVFFDNVYMYAKSAIPFMTEESPLQPPSRKGVVRKEIVDMIMNEVERNELIALVARAADFYGPENRNSALAEMVAMNLLKGKKAQVFGNPDKIHTYTYTPDAARATALLGNTPDAFNQVWHMPTTREQITGHQWIELFEKQLGLKAGIQQVPNWLIHLLGMFIPVMKEFPEMMYQYDQDYIFDSSKFEKRFGYMVTSPPDGVKAMVENLKLEMVKIEKK